MKYFIYTIIGLVLLIVGARIALDNFLEHRINKRLNSQENYEGSINNVSLNLIEGECRMQGLELKQAYRDSLIPYFKMDSAVIHVQWNSIFKGELVGTVDIYQPNLNMVMTKDTTEDQGSSYWGKQLTHVLPFKLKDIDVHNGKLSYTNLTVNPSVDAFMKNIQVTMKNLTNMEDSTKKLPASFKGSATTEGNGRLKAEADMDLVSSAPKIKSTFDLSSVDLTQYNDFIKAYGNFDIRQGTLDMTADLQLNDHSIDGYLHPVFENLKVFSLKEVGEQSLGKTGFEALLGLGTNLFENQKKKEVSTKIPLHGEISSIKTDFSTAIKSAMNN